MSASQEHEVRLARRTVVAGVGAAGVVAVLTACGSSKDSGGSGTVEPAKGATGEGDGAGDGGDSGAGGGGNVLAKTADIPEGGGKIFADAGVVVTQPKAGEFKAFSSKCTHMGCAVTSISGGTINCPCHGSKFDAATGDVSGGPATEPLPAATITVKGDSIMLAS
ncbi:Rieske (2Fe-2S) protein [Streptomyces sp. NPDC096354]|uniref:Rieske (2Fe-2S) protein n=1 Tax=Streptomyces sp. NPDC096354 TaxID=3366088 RepID=UPI003828E6D5